MDPSSGSGKAGQTPLSLWRKLAAVTRATTNFRSRSAGHSSRGSRWSLSRRSTSDSLASLPVSEDLSSRSSSPVLPHQSEAYVSEAYVSETYFPNNAQGYNDLAFIFQPGFEASWPTPEACRSLDAFIDEHFAELQMPGLSERLLLAMGANSYRAQLSPEAMIERLVGMLELLSQAYFDVEQVPGESEPELVLLKYCCSLEQHHNLPLEDKKVLFALLRAHVQQEQNSLFQRPFEEVENFPFSEGIENYIYACLGASPAIIAWEAACQKLDQEKTSGGEDVRAFFEGGWGCILNPLRDFYAQLQQQLIPLLTKKRDLGKNSGTMLPTVVAGSDQVLLTFREQRKLLEVVQGAPYILNNAENQSRLVLLAHKRIWELMQVPVEEVPRATELQQRALAAVVSACDFHLDDTGRFERELKGCNDLELLMGCFYRWISREEGPERSTLAELWKNQFEKAVDVFLENELKYALKVRCRVNLVDAVPALIGLCLRASRSGDIEIPKGDKTYLAEQFCNLKLTPKSSEELFSEYLALVKKYSHHPVAQWMKGQEQELFKCVQEETYRELLKGGKYPASSMAELFDRVRPVYQLFRAEKPLTDWLKNHTPPWEEMLERVRTFRRPWF